MPYLLRIVTLPIQSQGIITRDNVNVDVSAELHIQGSVIRAPVAA